MHFNKYHKISCPFWTVAVSVFLLLFCLAAAWCDFYFPGTEFTPTRPANGNTVAWRIFRGDVVIMPFHGNTFWAGDQLFTSFAGLKVQSDNGAYNLVIPKNGKTDELTTLCDYDFTVIQNPSPNQDPYNPVNLNSRYSVTYPGDPSHWRMYETLYNDFAPWRPLSRDYYGVAPGKYEISCNVYDHGEVPIGCTGSVSDNGAGNNIAGSFDYSLYIVDFAQQDRILPCNDTAVPISLATVPANLPNMSNLSICVEWEGMYSDLYTDASCLSMITGTGNKVSWNASSAPSVIYFKKSSNDLSAKTYRITLVASVNSETRDIAYKSVQSQGTFIVTMVNGGSKYTSDLQGYWNEELEDYPVTEWQDSVVAPDGEALDSPGSNSTEFNRPFLYHTGNDDAFIIHTVCIKHGDGITYSPDNYRLQAVSDDGMLNASSDDFTDTGNSITGHAFNGNHFSNIECKDVLITWKLINKNTGAAIKIGETKHKLYVISDSYNEYSNDKPYHTLVELACSAARGMSLSDTDALFDVLWEKIRGLRIYRIDGELLQYYGRGWNTNTGCYSDLIEYTDSQCYAWADLMKEAGALLGLELEIKEIDTNFEDDDYCGFLQNTDKAQGNDDLNLTLNINHTAGFCKHFVVEYDNRIYDPSIGEAADSFAEYLHNNILAYFFSGGVFQPIDPTLIPDWPDHFSYGVPEYGN